VSRSTASGFIGSATVLVSMKWHFGHSNIRFSDPFGRGAARANIIRELQRSHRGLSMAVSATSVNEDLNIAFSSGRLIAAPRNLIGSSAQAAGRSGS
jgi:hypothetical protein